MQYLKFQKIRSGFSKDIENTSSLSLKIEKKIATSSLLPDEKIENLTLEELQDLNKILGISNFILLKYEDRKELKVVLEYLVSVIADSVQSVESIDDEISELILSAEDSINKVKNTQSKISERFDLQKVSPNRSLREKPENGSNNLTKFTTLINTAEYQRDSKDSLQVI